MLPEDRDVAFLWDMRDNAQRLLRIMSGVTRRQFDQDEVVRLAAERLLQNIGEAARAVSTGFRSQHSEIPWQKIVGQRNILVHEYGEVKPELVWQTIAEDLEELVHLLDPLIPPIDE